jgi:dCMP deaminase
LLFAGRSLEFCTLYVTHHPCPTCAAKIVQAGIRRVVYLRQPEFEERWAAQLDVSRSIVSQAGVSVEGVLPWQS